MILLALTQKVSFLLWPFRKLGIYIRLLLCFPAPEQVEARMRAMDKARQRMQEKYDRLVEEKTEKLRQVPHAHQISNRLISSYRQKM